MIPLVLLFACQTDPAVDPGGDDGAAPDDLPTEYTYTPEDDGEVVLDSQALAEGIQAAMDVALGLSGQPVIDGYFSMLDDADDNCPTWYEQDGNVFWYDYCTSSTGALFDGYGFYYPYDNVDLDGTGTLWSGDYLYGVATITDSDGTWFHTGGGVQVLTGFNPGEDAFSDVDDSYYGMSQAVGGFEWTAPEADDTWIGAGIQPNLYLYTVDYPGYGIRGAMVDGGISGLSGDATAVLFDNNFIYHEAAGSLCEQEPTGSIQLRDADGRWWVVDFDTPDGGTMSRELCDGCGTVSYAGEELGEVCVDFSGWLDWELSTW